MDSVLAYPLTFIVSSVFFWFSGKSAKTLRYASAFLGIMLLSLLAGFRDLSIGTDIQVYVVPIFEEVRNQSFVEMIRIYSSSESSTPVGFGLLA